MNDLPMIIDSFAGGGGASTGIERALGRSPDVAINHNPAALALHAANHPDTLHLDSNIWDVDPLTVTGGRHVGLMWASPDCKHFSKAKGGAPKDRNIRDLAWVVVRWAEDVKPDVICMENVEEFQTWGPLDNEGQPIKEFAGQTYELWIKRLKSAGYKVQWRELRACDYGAPTIRNRYFLVARRDGKPIIWPKPTHGDPKSEAVRKGKLLPWRTAAECIDWSITCPSIFDTSEEIKAKHGLTAKRPLADNTLARIARGMKRYVIDADRPFLVNLTHGGRTEDTAEPFRTITCAHRGEKAVVAPSITRFNGGATGAAIGEPMPTVTANSWIKKPGGAAPLGLLAPQLVSVAHGDSGGRREYPVTDPYGVVTAGGISHAVVAPSLLSLKGTERRDMPVTAPHPTVLAGGGHSALVAATIVGCGGRAAQSRPRGIDEPFATVTGKADACHAVAFIAQHNTGVIARDARDPMSTVTGAGSHQQPVAAFFAKYYGTGDGSRHDEPAHTITTKDRFAHAEAALAASPFGPEHEARARAVAEFLRAHEAWTGGEYVTLPIGGAVFVVVDIGMRMLTPRELFNAQGFDSDYVIEGVWREEAGEWVWQPFAKDVQVSCCGNSVCPPLAATIVGANCQHLIRHEVAA